MKVSQAVSSNYIPFGELEYTNAFFVRGTHPLITINPATLLIRIATTQPEINNIDKSEHFIGTTCGRAFSPESGRIYCIPVDMPVELVDAHVVWESLV